MGIVYPHIRSQRLCGTSFTTSFSLISGFMPAILCEGTDDAMNSLNTANF
jgi:hypothetical protein